MNAFLGFLIAMMTRIAVIPKGHIPAHANLVTPEMERTVQVGKVLVSLLLLLLSFVVNKTPRWSKVVLVMYKCRYIPFLSFAFFFFSFPSILFILFYFISHFFLFNLIPFIFSLLPLLFFPSLPFLFWLFSFPLLYFHLSIRNDPMCADI